MAAREAQIEQKMRQVRQEQQESLRRREELLEDIDRANQLTRREEEQKEQAKSARKTELESQVKCKISCKAELELLVKHFLVSKCSKGGNKNQSIAYSLFN